MAVTAKLFAYFPCTMGGGNAAGSTDGPIDILSDTLKTILTTSGYNPGTGQGTNRDYSDVTNELTTTGGYTVLGKTLTTPTYAPTALVTTFDADDVSWTSATFTARNAVVFKSTGTGSTSPLIGYVDFGADQTVSSGTFTIQWNASGIFTITVA